MMMMMMMMMMLMMMMITVVLRMMLKMMKGIFGVCLGGLVVLWAPFGAVFGHFDALLERSKTKPKVERTRHLDFSRTSRAKSLFSSVAVSKRALRTASFSRMSRAKLPFLNIRAIPRIHFFGGRLERNRTFTVFERFRCPFQHLIFRRMSRARASCFT